MNGTETLSERFKRMKAEKEIRIKSQRQLRKALVARFQKKLSEVSEEIENGEHSEIAANAHQIFRFSMERAKGEVNALLRHCCESEFDKYLQDTFQKPFHPEQN